MAVVGGWLKLNRDSIFGAKPLPAGETASGFATARGPVRYLFALPVFIPADQPYPGNQQPPRDETLTLSGVAQPAAVALLATGQPLEFTYANGVVAVKLPATQRTKLVDVVQVRLPGGS